MDTHILIFSGRAVKDAEVQQSKAGNSYTKFTVAVNEFYKTEKKDAKAKDKAEKTTSEVTYYDCLVFGDKIAKAAGEKVKKGTTLLIEGRPEFSAFLTKNNEARPDLTVVVSNWHAIG